MTDALQTSAPQTPAAAAAGTTSHVITGDSSTGPTRGEAGGPVLALIAHGTPGPQGSKTGYNVGGRVVMRESSKKVKPWRSDVRDAAERAIPHDWIPIDGPVAVDMVFTLRKPTSAPKRRRTWPDRTPDLSKLARSTEDALTGLVWADDARIVEYRTLAKRYPLEGPDALTYPGVIVRVYRLDDTQPTTTTGR